MAARRACPGPQPETSGHRTHSHLGRISRLSGELGGDLAESQTASTLAHPTACRRCQGRGGAVSHAAVVSRLAAVSVTSTRFVRMHTKKQVTDNLFIL